MTKKHTFIENLKRTHTSAAIRKRLKQIPKRSQIKDFIYGAMDGIVTTFAVVAGVAGARLSITIIIILGLANLLADSFSMAIGNFTGTKAEEELRSKIENEEKKHIQLIPEGEKEEIRQIFKAKGFSGEELERVVSVITSDVKVWLDTMMKDELGFTPQKSAPLRAATTTFFAFLCIGIFPLLPFIVNLLLPNLLAAPFLWSIFMTGIAFFLIGGLKGQFVEKKWYKSGLQTLVIGMSAAGLAYLVGAFLKGIY